MKIILIFTSAFVALTIGHSFDPYPDIYEPDYLKRAHDEGSLSIRDTKNFRITDDAIPSFYKLTLTPFISQQKYFLGEVEIEFTIKRSLQTIVLNQQKLNITSQKLLNITDPLQSEIKLNECFKNDQYEKLECGLTTGTLDPSKTYKLIFKYEGVVHDDMRGFYESYYFDEKGAKKTLGTTHFGQQTRRLMPCFDEPKFKAQFQLNIGRNPKVHSVSISNANLQKTTNVTETWVIDEYKPTSIISTYILAFVISDFKDVSDNVREDHTFGIYARPNAIDQAGFAFQLGPKIIKAFDEWNAISYYDFKDVEKMDIAAIPDFSAGAMENWGMLLHREANLLVDDDHTNTQQKQRIASVISHEISHMWFGDLVTCDWFDAIWLNEGFARYFENVALDPVHKDWKMLDDFVVATLHNALSADAVRSSHPLTNPGVNSYPEIRTLFSTITYDKGGSVLRMMHNIMGIDKFQNGIRAYLKNHQYSTAVPQNLFEELQKQDSSVSPEEIMKSYTEQSGYPLVTVKRDGDVLKLTQKRFLIDEIDHNLTSTWTIPITYAITKDDLLNKRAHLTLFKEGSLNITISNMSLDFYLLNVQQVGFYRVNYEKENWQAIGKALKSDKHGGIHVLNRAQIIDDLFNLARVGYLSYDFILNIIDYVQDDKEYLPWQATLNGLSYLMQRIPDEKYKNSTYTFVNDLLSMIYKKLDFKKDGTHQDKLNRINILNWACKYGNEECQKRAKKEFDDVVKKNATIDPDWKPAVYCTGLRETTGNWDTFWERYVKTNYATEEATILTALGCTKNEKEINKFLDKILTDEIRLQDKSSAYSRAYTGNLENIDIVYSYITKNHAKWSKVMDLASTLSDLANRFTTTAQVEKLEKFITDTKLTEDVKTKLTSAVTRSKKNLEWDSNRLKEVNSYFDGGKGSAGSITVMKVLVSVLAIITVVLF